MSHVISNVLLVILNVLLVGGVIAFVGTLLVSMLRAYLLIDPPAADAEKREN